MNKIIEKELLETKTRDEFKSVCKKHNVEVITGEYGDVLLHYAKLVNKENGGIVVHRDVFKTK